ncbi:Glucosamine--fructose-6-phosphate aminotransferase [isomerizing] [uncultured Ruminococcus sp.]|uniref:Glutamine--fructose-6-phosphate aminotransferase [isomerizing] n=1 Tax=Massiliimalia timonensis TaxID=1987501 RepID=A0A8J6PA40_9FIRM|nr:glutamine--fructose-6-phosphate transaminase (isomerizing) [Massiliimalia timonensis]MBC8610012.1 glutamine--fructose-6-phosphate transaminase (isomerizing) [Massiliimalia timonensis]SCH14646.1 Glucosamine--fructose-6-phosphate aminotransferase [isomerizing] [uncultured Ruminococcus sp.]SCH81500.1 Glucosamine--fructose-6-phosphate aminotransferase [isomerizing] [uncultured Clostridium sp.]
MCGIVGYIGKNNAAEILVDGLRKLEYRGYDSAGIAVFEDEGIKVVKAKGRLSDLEEKMKLAGVPKGCCGIGHTRWATHGEPSDVNSHPHGNSRVTLVHNGIIENYLEIKERLISKGYVFESETDTEAVAKLLDYYYDGNPFEAVKKVIQSVKGSYAFGMMFSDYPDQIFAVRKDSPMIVGLGEEENFIASDVPAILKYTKDYYLIDENEIVILKKDGVKVLNLDQEPIEKERQTATWDIEAAEKGGYPHFMLKEIFEQPEALRKTVAPRIKDGLPDLQVEAFTDELIRSVGKIHIVACGTASYAGMIGKCALEKLVRVPAEVCIASEFRYNDPILAPDDLVIVISQSGETADTLAALRLAKEKGIHTMAIVNVVGSSIAREADSIIYTWAGPEIAVASTKAYTVQMSVMYLIALKMALVRGTLTEEEVRRYCEIIQAMPEKQQDILAQSDTCQYFASRFQNAEHLFYIGRGLDYALSMEGSLKLKEISYIHSEAYAAGELKHGTISLITDHVPVVAVATQEHIYEKTISNIKEVTTRGAKVLLVVNDRFEVKDDIADYILRLPTTEDVLMPLLAVIPLQLFAYYTAVLRGCDVDKPRNLAKSVTVE